MIQLEKCPSCGSENIKNYLSTKDYFFSGEEFSIDKCDVCHLIFTNPRPDGGELWKYYKTKKYLSHNSSSSNPVTLIYNLIRKINIRRKYHLISSYKKKGDILDIGCGTGELLAYFNKKKWKTLGIEPDEGARSIARHDNKVDTKTLEYLEKNRGEAFDVITMWHVLEHVANLHERLDTVRRMLKGEGVGIIAVPNILSQDSQYYKEYWAGLDVPRHLYHFSAHSMEKLLTMHHLKIIKCVPMKFDSLYVSWLSEQYLGHKFAFFRGVKKGLLFNLKSSNNEYSSTIFVIRHSN